MFFTTKAQGFSQGTQSWTITALNGHKALLRQFGHSPRVCSSAKGGFHCELSENPCAFVVKNLR
jgi:hypothetical protein